MNEDERQKLQQQITLNQKEQELYIMRTSKTILSILHRDSDKIKQGGRVTVLDEKSAKKLYRELYITRTSKTTLSILQRDFDKIKQGDRVTVIDEKSTKKLYSRLSLGNSDGDTYKITFETEKGLLKDVLSPSNNWLTPNGYLRIFGKNFIKDMGFDVDKPKGGAKSKIPKERVK